MTIGFSDSQAKVCMVTWRPEVPGGPALVTLPPGKSQNHAIILLEQPQEGRASQLVEQKLNLSRRRQGDELFIFLHSRVCSKAHICSLSDVYVVIYQTLLETFMEAG